MARWQLVAAGVPARTIDHHLAAGRLHRLHRGVYAVGHLAVTDRGRLRAALLAAGDGSVLSHRSAVVWRIHPVLPESIDVTLERRRPRPRSGLVIHFAAPLDAVNQAGMPVTRPARTLLDLAATRSRGEVERALTEALVLRLVRSQDLVVRGHRGAATLAALLDDGAGPTRREFERRMVRLVKAAGLPRPIVNQRVLGHEADLLWPDQRVIVETDGWTTHGHRRAFETDRSRDTDLQAAGYAVLRFTWRQLRDEPLRVAARLAQVLSIR